MILLFIAMPLKYFAGLPIVVTVIGGLHGVLFVAFALYAWEVKTTYKKDLGWLMKASLASLLPFGTFYMDREWKKEAAAVV